MLVKISIVCALIHQPLPQILGLIALAFFLRCLRMRTHHQRFVCEFSVAIDGALVLLDSFAQSHAYNCLECMDGWVFDWSMDEVTP